MGLLVTLLFKRDAVLSLGVYLQITAGKSLPGQMAPVSSIYGGMSAGTLVSEGKSTFLHCTVGLLLVTA